MSDSMTRTALPAWTVFFAASATATLVGIFTTVTFSQDPQEALLKEARGTFQPIPKDGATAESPVTPDRVELGRKLFFDPRISIDGTGSCVHCHQPSLYGTDGLPKASGVQGKMTPRNSPTVLNASLHFRIHWDGVLEDVEEQARKSLLGPGFGNPDFAAAMIRIKGIPGYPELFHKTFPDEADPVTEGNWAKAIGAYERTLVTSSRLDDYLGGKTGALTAEEKRGLRTFLDVGCANCHRGALLGGTNYEKFGVTGDYWKETHSAEVDEGRFKVTKNSDDRYVFKVPSLRNVDKTPPYFHDGSVKTLPEAVRIMAKLQLDKDLSDQETKGILTFLASLTGSLPENFANVPILPPAAFDSQPAAVK